MTIVLNDKLEQSPPGLVTLSWRDPEAAKLGIKEVTDRSPRAAGAWIRAIVAHTHEGTLGKTLRPGLGPNTDKDLALARYQTNTTRQVSWDFTQDTNGEWIIQNDPLKFYTWHATSVNPISVGFEMIQESNGDLYEGQIEKTVLFIDWLTAKLGIQRQIPWDTKANKPMLRQVQRISGPNAGKDVVGIYGHVNQTTNRGPGDPGPWLFEALKKAGYMTFSFDSDDDKVFWKAKQASLGVANPDGIPGPATRKLLKEAGHAHGMLVSRPVDALISSE